MAIIPGTPNPDVIVGTADADVINGGGGNDRINGGAGNDRIYGEAGNDTLTGDAGNDELYGGDGNDGFFGGGNDDTVYGEAGIDSIFGDDGNDILYGGADNDTINGGNGNDQLYGGSGVDTLIGGAGDDIIDGGVGNDLITGGVGNDTIVYRGGEGTDVLVGGTGRDTLQIELTAAQLTPAVRADLAALDAWLKAAPSATNLAAENTSSNLTLSSLDISLGGIEAATLAVDGQVVSLASLLNQAPETAATSRLATDEDTPVTGLIVASDADGDALTWKIAEQPSNGVLSLDSKTGAYTYTPVANYSGADSFLVDVVDPSGATTQQRVSVAIGAIADAPSLSVANSAISGSEQLTGTVGDDVIQGGVGDDVIAGGDGDDRLSGDGGTFAHTIALDIAAALTDADGSETLAIVVGGVPSDGELSAGVRNDDGTWSLTGQDLADLSLRTSATATFKLSVAATSTERDGATATTQTDLVVTVDLGQGGNDVIDGGAGDDVIYGGVGNDRIIDGLGNDVAYGGDGDDLFIAGAGNDAYFGGSGFDTIDFSAATSVKVDLGSKKTGLGVDKFDSIEGVAGSAGGDWIKGDSAANVLDGGKGDDTIYGVGGNDRLVGGDGNDKLYGGSGDDVLFDGAGDDYVKGGAGNDLFIAGSGNDSYFGSSGFDTLDYSGATSGITVDASKKTVTGYTNDRIDGIEKIVGTSFDDTYKGSKRADVFEGGAGNDTIRGMGGADVLSGGDGNDTFVWLKKDVAGNGKDGIDRITDFSTGDVLDLRDFAKGGKFSSGSDIQVTDGAAGSTISVKVGGHFVDVVNLEGVHGLSAGDMLAQGLILA